ncbi:MAG: cardiolipin synthase [Lachnospiraceae bacterium]|nr:cardiolipin synthase [Lachnospiraceae bacterium]
MLVRKTLAAKAAQSRYERQHKDRLFLSKIIVVGILIVLQIALIAYVTWRMGTLTPYYQLAYTFVSVIVMIYIVNRKDNPAYQLAWSVLILLFPLFGGIFYLVIAGNRSTNHFVRKMQRSIQDSYQLLPQDADVKAALSMQSGVAAMQSGYIARYGPYPVYRHTKIEYYPLGDDHVAPLLEALRGARRYIFLEYFIIREGVFWNSVLNVLEQKAAEGIDVRVLIDDFGCVATIPPGYEKRLQEKGIQCLSFNRFIPVLTLRLNNRDHRKITVIDGHTGFTGGVNLSDEYINVTHPYGHWKDVGVMLRGEAVWSLTVMFLQMWDYVAGITEDYTQYAPRPEEIADISDDGYVQPYSDSPLDDEVVGENIYLNMINHARKSVYIITPYLILDHEMITALSLAAKNGVDVRLILPGIPDKKMAYTLTKANAEVLIEEGVHIHLYTPGFTHAKIMVADDELAVVGTVNMDFRSLYLHFECGVWMYNNSVIEEIGNDFKETLKKCRELTIEEYQKLHWYQRVWRALLRFLSPLL